jgi:hypothetical protein
MERNDKEKNKHISIIHEIDMIQNLKNIIILMTFLIY